MKALTVGIGFKINSSSAVTKIKNVATRIKAVSVSAMKAGTSLKTYSNALGHLKGKLGQAVNFTRRWLSKLKESGDAAGTFRDKTGRLRDGLGRYTKGLTKAANKTSGFGKKIKGLSGRLNSLSSKLKVLAIGTVIGGAALFGGAVNSAIEFESTMADVKKVVDFDTPQQFKEMRADILKLSTEIPITANGFGEIIAAAGQASIPRAELKGFAVDAAKLSIAFDISAKEAGSAMTGLRNIFKLNQKEVMNLAGTYNQLSNKFDATARDILNVGNRAGKLAQTYNITGKELASFSTTMLASKVGPEETATSLQTFIGRLGAANKQGDKFKAAMDSIGLPVNKFKAMLDKDATGTINLFLKKMQSAKDKAGTMTDLFGIEHAPKLLSLVNNVEMLGKAQEITGAKTNWAKSIQDEYASRAATTENTITLLKNQVKKVGIEFGSAFLPLVNSLIKDVTPAIEFVSLSVRQFFGDTTDQTPQWIIGLKVIFNSFSPIISAVKTGFADLWNTITGGGEESTSEVSGFVVTAAKIGTQIEKIAPIVTKVFGVLSVIVGDVAIPVLSELGGALLDVWSELTNGGQKAENGVNPVVTAFDNVKLVIQNVAPVVKFVASVIATVMVTGAKIIGRVFNFVHSEINTLLKNFDKTRAKGSEAFIKLTAQVKTVFLQMILFIIKKMEKIPFLGKAFKGLGKELKATISQINADKEAKLLALRMEKTTKSMKAGFKSFADASLKNNKTATKLMESDLINFSKNAGKIFNGLNLVSQGKKMMQTFGLGIKSQEKYLKNTVGSVLQTSVRRQLPSSDAKEGPLSTLTANGKGFVTAFSTGITANAQHLKGAVSQSLTGLDPMVTFRTHTIADAVKLPDPDKDGHFQKKPPPGFEGREPQYSSGQSKTSGGKTLQLVKPEAGKGGTKIDTVIINLDGSQKEISKDNKGYEALEEALKLILQQYAEDL